MINPKSLVNLEKARAAKAKPNFKRCNFSLRPETVKYLKKYPNMSTAIDKIIADVRRSSFDKPNSMYMGSSNIADPEITHGSHFSDSHAAIKIAALEREVNFLREQNSRLRSQLSS